mmetsp:Transcript_22266/g.58160  ORF Transcript_22266/g.58160 Transcript_22266/m.58160 type:complete len:302 (-) Transcript_22266:653-1558(-)|eukprot:CAMPEP_0182950512 /NCGR_PEP_ID=MMETSP0105_2-20130417/60801_1 /TAXON_ID=81532 ORGANISM="Acanthoeca-like sp., Strain 10tr" /NCGR_SAMPLE_ID=MMETSP0105_2 /ASSEMBLY_ACC=CAM_ASM_000205 /LENGTH=301 /DNA_ID=CAMNT_0025090815 /DNA_START=82 /DNA_END=987 /DNA_ORIENTATION=+
MRSLHALPAVHSCVALAALATGPVDGTAAGGLPAITRGLRAFWSFGEAAGEPKIDAMHGYALHDNTTTPADRVPGIPGLFSGYAVSLNSNHLVAPRASVPGIANISGPHATVTLAAWVKIGAQQGGGFIGGVWNEAQAWRQFALFVTMAVCNSISNGTVAHISGAGGPEAGRQYCNSAACGTTDLGDGKWHCIANVYNSTDILAYVDGELDNHGDSGDRHNPFKYPDPPKFPIGGIFTPPPGGGADFAVGSHLIHPGGGVGPSTLGQVFHGELAGLAVFDTALSAAEMRTLCGPSSAAHPL